MGEEKDNTVSREEMDALLKEEEKEFLSQDEISALKELFGPAFEVEASTLATILKSEVRIPLPEIKTTLPAKLKEEFREDVFVAEVSYGGVVSGSTYIIISKKTGAIIADLMMGGDGTSPPDQINELYLGAVGEAVSQIMNTSCSILSKLIGSQVTISHPKVTLANFAEEEIDLPLLIGKEPLTQVSSKMRIDGLIEESPVAQIFSVSLAKAIIAARSAPMGRSAGMIHPVQFAPLKPGGTREVSSNIDLLMDIPMTVSVELGRTSMLVKDVLGLGVGSVIELEKLAGEPVDFLVNGKLIAKGGVVVIDENFGLRITDIISPSERLDNLRQGF